ncbi:hypothetical protein [Geminisphaera colitermitum]|nr:hypothetical protein [Geminisphaera colitermitum]
MASPPGGKSHDISPRRSAHLYPWNDYTKSGLTKTPATPPEPPENAC